MLTGNLSNFRADPAVLLFLVGSVVTVHTGELIIGRTSVGSVSLALASSVSLAKKPVPRMLHRRRLVSLFLKSGVCIMYLK